MSSRTRSRTRSRVPYLEDGVQQAGHVAVQGRVVEGLQQAEQGGDVDQEPAQQVAQTLGVARHQQEDLEAPLRVQRRVAFCGRQRNNDGYSCAVHYTVKNCYVKSTKFGCRYITLGYG